MSGTVLRIARKLLKALRNSEGSGSIPTVGTLSDVTSGNAQYHIGLSDCRLALRDIPDGAANLVITDPPHSDRVPYLELSEFWNSLLGHTASFESEIVISNAKERAKNQKLYQADLGAFFTESTRVLAANGRLVVLFNARKESSWQAYRTRWL